jgi:hypothetical protein
MSKQPQQRFPSMDHLADALDQFLETSERLTASNAPHPTRPTFRPAATVAAPHTPAPVASPDIAAVETDGLIDLTQPDALAPIDANLDAQGLTLMPLGEIAPAAPRIQTSDPDSRRVIVLASAAGGGVLALLLLAMIVTRLLRDDTAPPSSNLAPAVAANEATASPRAFPETPAASSIASNADVPSVDGGRSSATPAPANTYGQPPANDAASPSTQIASTPTIPAETRASRSELPITPAIADTAPAAASPSGSMTLDQAVHHWRSQPNATLRGARLGAKDDQIVQRYSWLVELLPHLGHEELYNRFRFDQAWTEGPNLQLSAALIPQFLNPADDRQRWTGYPFQGMGLTHYVGMAGVEDRPNEVAAKLPRSDPKAGIFGYEDVARPEQITDGVSQTIMVLGAGELVSPWVQGGGATVRGARKPYFDPLTGHERRVGRRSHGHVRRRLGANDLAQHRPCRVPRHVYDSRRRVGGRSGHGAASERFPGRSVEALHSVAAFVFQPGPEYTVGIP